MWYYIVLWYSLLGGLFLILSRSFGDALHYLSGYLYILSYVIVLILIIFTGKRINLGFSDNFKVIALTFVAMTVLYILFVLLKNYLS